MQLAQSVYMARPKTSGHLQREGAGIKILKHILKRKLDGYANLLNVDGTQWRIWRKVRMVSKMQVEELQPIFFTNV